MLEASGEESALSVEPEEGSSPASGVLRIGPYRLLRLLARGGMGEVHLAERTDGAFQQLVAIKLLRPGLESSEMLARFELERELLASLSHPAVVPLLDGGTTEEGRPYLVLQYVEGEPITLFCQRRRLGRRERVRLLVRLCHAVEYAHRNLIVHRDLKPSNILVSGGGEVRLLDFGIAKLLSSEPPRGEATRAPLAPMTPERAAPEQRRGEPVTTATDVWALGALLHEVLAGGLPPGLTAGAPDLGSLARVGTDRDLTAIVARSLESEPERRYASAGSLAEDLERWLDGEPVRARPDRLGYRLRRFVGRHRAAVAAGSAALLALAALAATSMVQSYRLRRAQERTAAEAQKAQQVVDLLVEILGAANPFEGAQGQTIELAELLRRGEERAASLANQPEVQARLRHTLGRVYLERGDSVRARSLLASAREAEFARLGPEDLSLLSLRFDYARALHSGGDLASARAELEALTALLAAHPSAPSADRAHVLLALGSLTRGEAGEGLVQQAIELLRAGPALDPVDLAGALTVLATQRQMRGDRRAAREIYQEALNLEKPRLGDEHPGVLSIESNLANLLEDPAARVAEHRRLIAVRTRLLGERSSLVATSWGYLGEALLEQGDVPAAAAAYAKAYQLWQAAAGPRHGRTLASLRSLGWLLTLEGKAAEALARYRELCRQLDTAELDPALAASYRSELARALATAGRVAEAEREARAVLEAIAQGHLEAPRSRARAALVLAQAKLERGEAIAAAADFEKALAELPTPPPALEKALLEGHLGRALVACGEAARARTLLEQALNALAGQRQVPPLDVEALRRARSRLAE